MNDHEQAPTTIKEVGIHVGYMRDDLKELKDIIKTLPSSFVSVKDHAELEKRVAKIESKNGLKNAIQWTALAVTTIISIISLYNLWNQ